ncbi:MAG: extracellular solute-binding protein [Thermomicrobiales bacterium]
MSGQRDHLTKNDGHAMYQPQTSKRYSRRHVLQTALGAASAAGVLAPGLHRGALATQATPQMGDLVAGVDYFPSPAPGVPVAYVRVPPSYTTVNETPGRGGTVTIFTISYFPPVPSRDDNSYWQELESRLGVTIEMTPIPANAYDQRFATMAASGDFADMTNLPGPRPAHLQAIEQGAFTDLTSYLTGDALQDYPNLALLPPQVWANSAINGKVYGVPRPLPLVDSSLAIRKDWAEQYELWSPTNADEFQQVLVNFTENDPDGNGSADTWGIAAAEYGMGYIQQIFRAPNNWRLNDDGSLTHMIETEEFRAAIEYAHGLFDAGVFHPDAATMAGSEMEQAIAGGVIGAYTAGMQGLWPAGKVWDQFATVHPDLGNPVERIVHLVAPGHDGGAGAQPTAPGFFGIAAIPASVGQDEKRVRELLRILDWWAAPFGSEEWRFKNYGLEGVHHDVGEDGSLVKTEQGNLEIGDFWHLASGEREYISSTSGGAKYMQDVTAEMLAIGVDDPTMGLYPEAVGEHGAELEQFLIDQQIAIISGRSPLDALTEMIDGWESRGGDQIRAEYEAGLAAR